MTSIQREIAFIDRNVNDLATLLAALRSDVEPILLSADTPAPQQIAEAVKHRTGLTAIHVIAHGAPGQVNCGARTLAPETLEDDGEDLATIGRVLGSEGSLLLWSCHTAAGERGAAFVDALARATGTKVSATAGLVGAAALGGRWELDDRAGEARAPLTADGMANYDGVMATKTWTGALAGGSTTNPASQNWNNSFNWSPNGVPVANDDVVIGGNSGGSYQVTLDTNTPALGSLLINFTGNTATLAIGSGRILNVNGTGTDTVTVQGTNVIDMSGGTLNTGTVSLSASTSDRFRHAEYFRSLHRDRQAVRRRRRHARCVRDGRQRDRVAVGHLGQLDPET
jgi:hypothetical protein